MKTKVCLSVTICFFVMQIVGAQYPVPETINPDDWGTLVFNEEFDGPIDPAKWYPQFPYGNIDPGNFFYAKPENLVSGNGMLRIDAKKESIGGVDYTTGVLWSKQKFKYGYFEIRFKLPSGHGFWPAFWLYGPGATGGSDEIDAFEGNGRFWNIMHIDIHCNDGCHSQGDWIVFNDGINFMTDFHTIGVLWSPDEIKFYKDRTFVERRDHSYGYAMSIIADLGLSPGGFIDPGVDASTPFPSYMYVDYIKAWQLQDCQTDVEYCDYLPNDDSYNTVITGNNITLGSAVNTCNVTLSPIPNQWWYIPRYMDLYATNSIKLDARVKIEEGARFSANITSCPQPSLKSAPVSDSPALNKSLDKTVDKIPKELKIFPNPNHGMFTIQLPDQSKSYDITILNQLGEVVYQQKVFSQNQVHLDLTQQPKGVYVVKIVNDAATYSSKVIIE